MFDTASFLRVAIFPLFIAAIIAFTICFVLEKIGFFDGQPILYGIFTGAVLSIIGIVLGYFLAAITTRKT